MNNKVRLKKVTLVLHNPLLEHNIITGNVQALSKNLSKIKKMNSFQ